jgi:hypothetical protein
MGHLQLGTLSQSKKWQQVVEELEIGADVGTIAGASAEAAEAALSGAAQDPVFTNALWLLTQIPLAARGPDYAKDLEALGLHLSDHPTLFDLTSAISVAIDNRARVTGGRTDLGEMAQLALIESLTAAVAPQLPSLFGPTPGDVRDAVGRLAGGDRFAKLARDFFSRLTHRCLDYYLSREMANHVGEGGRFADDGVRARFDAALGVHCYEAALIVEAFSGGWYGKNIYQGDGLTRDKVEAFAQYAFRKIRAELVRRRDAA